MLICLSFLTLFNLQGTPKQYLPSSESLTNITLSNSFCQRFFGSFLHVFYVHFSLSISGILENEGHKISNPLRLRSYLLRRLRIRLFPQLPDHRPGSHPHRKSRIHTHFLQVSMSTRFRQISLLHQKLLRLLNYGLVLGAAPGQTAVFPLLLFVQFANLFNQILPNDRKGQQTTTPLPSFRIARTASAPVLHSACTWMPLCSSAVRTDWPSWRFLKAVTVFSKFHPLLSERHVRGTGLSTSSYIGRFPIG